MIYSLLIQHPSSNTHTAYRFCQALLAAGHQINCLFFYQQGVQALHAHQTDWKILTEQYGIPAYGCINSLIAEGFLADTAGAETQLPVIVAGLATFFAATMVSDRVLTF